MTTANYAWTTFNTPSYPFFKLAFLNGTSRLVESAEMARDFVANQKLQSISIVMNPEETADVSYEMARVWLNEQPYYIIPEFIPQLVKDAVSCWKTINAAKPAIYFDTHMLGAQPHTTA